MSKSIAMVAADMTLAGIKSTIPTDEVILAMYKIGCENAEYPEENSIRRVSRHPTGKELECRIFGI